LGAVQLHETPLPWQGSGEDKCMRTCMHASDMQHVINCIFGVHAFVFLSPMMQANLAARSTSETKAFCRSQFLLSG